MMVMEDRVIVAVTISVAMAVKVLEVDTEISKDEVAVDTKREVEIVLYMGKVIIVI